MKMRTLTGVLLLAACGAQEDAPAVEGSEAPAPSARAGAQCAVDPRSGALIGEIVGRGEDPTTGAPAYAVRLETAPDEIGYVHTGVRVAGCVEVRREQREENPEPVPAAGSQPSGGG